MFYVFYPTASATAYGRRSKFVVAKHSATAEGENCAYGPTLVLKEEFHQKNKAKLSYSYYGLKLHAYADKT